MESEGESSSDDSLSNPTPVPSHLFCNGPITLKAYRAACERTPAQPRRSRGGQLRASVPEEEQSSLSNRIEEVQPAQTHPKLLQERSTKFIKSQAQQRVQSRPDSIYDLPTSQGSDLNRSSTSSQEPAHDNEVNTATAPRLIQPSAKSRQARLSTLGGDPLARLSAAKKKVKKRYIARRPSPVMTRTSPMLSESEDIPKAMPPKKRQRKERKLPMENKLVMVPALGTRGSSETAVYIDSDPIEEIQTATPAKSKRAACTPSQLRRRPLHSIQKNLRLPLQNGSPISDAFSFRALRKTLPIAKSLLKDLAREGFDDHELVLPPRNKRKKATARRGQFAVPRLLLINARDFEELPMTSSLSIHHNAKDFAPELDFTQKLPDQPDESFVGPKLTVQDVEPQEDAKMLPPKPTKIHHVIQPKPVFRRLRRVSFYDEVQSQLMSVTAPTRESSDSEDESELSDSHDSDTESGLEPDHSEKGEEFEEIGFTPSRGNNNHGTELDDIEDEELLLELAHNGVDSNIKEKNEAKDAPGNYLTRPGQLVRIKSSGTLIEVPDDCIEVHSSSDLANSIPGYKARYHSSLTDPTSTRMAKPLKSILKNRTDARQSKPSQSETQSAQVHAECEGSKYFSQAQRQLRAPIRRASIVPRRHSQQVFRESEDSDDDNDADFESDVQASTAARVSDFSQSFLPTSAIPRRGTNIPITVLKTRGPAPNLHTLVRRTSQEFGTTSARLRRTPSLPFVPPFLKDRT